MHRHFKLLLGVGWLLAAMSATAADLTISGIYTRYADETELDTVAIGAGELVAITSNEVPTGRMVVGTDGSTGYSYVFDEGGDFDWSGAHDFSAATVTLLDTHIPTDLTISTMRDAESAWLATSGTTDGEDFRLVLGTTQGFATRIDIKDASSTIVLYSDSVVVENTLTVTGAVSAASFAGDGSGITNVTAAAIQCATKITATNYTVGTDNSSEMYGGVIYVTAACTQLLPAVSAGMSVTIIADGANIVTIDVNASDQVKLDGSAFDTAGDGIVSGGTAGEIAVITYYSGDGWYAATDGWASE